MTRAERIEVSVMKAINEGMEFLGKGMGDYTEAFNAKRAEGYVVGCWYTSITKESRQWVMYGRKKETSSKKAVFTTNPITEQTYYHGFQTEPEVNYGEMTVKALKEICKARKIAGYSKMNKQQMVESLQQAC